MTLKAAILDDEKHARETLQWQLERLGDDEVEIVGIYGDSLQAVEALKSDPPDLIFLDIAMPGLNGFQFLKQLDDKNVHIIFTTAYGKFAVDAFRVNAVDYLIKPIETSELREAVNRVKTGRSSRQHKKLEEVYKQMKHEKAGRSKIAVPSVHGIDFMYCQDIVFCESEGNYTRIHLEGGEKKLASRTLKDIEKLLPDVMFYRLHNSHIANLSKVTGYSHEDGGMLILNGTHKLRVSRTKKKELLQRLEVG